MSFAEFINSIPHAEGPDTLLIFGLILVAGGAGGWLARQLRLPTVTGNLMAGALIGPTLGIVDERQASTALLPLSMFASAFIMVTIGGHLSWRRIHNAFKRIIWIAWLETFCAFTLTTLAMHYLLGANWPLALLMGVFACDTAPATLLHISRETRAKGPFIKTLLSVVALDNIFSITLFVIITTLLADKFAESAGMTGGDTQQLWLHQFWRVGGSAMLGLFSGWVTEQLVRRTTFHHATVVFIAILISTGMAGYLQMSPLLCGVFIGLYLGNSTRAGEQQLAALEPIEWILYIGFFTLAGINLHFEQLAHVGVMGLAFVGLRIIGKSLGAFLGAKIAGASPRITQNMPLGLVPQAGVAVALIVVLNANDLLPAELRTTVVTLVLGAIVVNELVGPLTTRLALRRAGEADKGRHRLVTFLQEEFIKVHMKARDKADAIRQLCDFLIRSHRVEHIHPDDLFRSVMEREVQETTAIGKGAAIPHGTVAGGPEIQGVLGILDEGLDFGASDGEPVRIIMLIVTPDEDRTRHLKVLAALAGIISHPVMRSRIVAAEDANEIWEIIEDEETPDYNYFLED